MWSRGLRPGLRQGFHGFHGCGARLRQRLPLRCRALTTLTPVRLARSDAERARSDSEPSKDPPKAGGVSHAKVGAGVLTVQSGSETIVVYALCGNLVIACAKGLCAVHSGSSAMAAEAVHSAVDAGNQALLLVGLRLASRQPDRVHQYGYGKSVYVWSLVSALGTFWLGSGVALNASISELMVHTPSVDLDAIARWDVCSVLAMSFAIEGFVLFKSMSHVAAHKPANKTFFQHVKELRDPTLLAVLLEDSAACAGIIIAAGGLAAAHVTGIHAFDAASGVAVGCLLGAVGATLAAVNGRFLLGPAVEKEIVDGIEALLRSRSAVEHVHSVQSQWVGPDAFSYKCEVDFDGTWIAAQLYSRYEPHFREAPSGELPLLLSFFAEDVMRTVESEVRDIEALIRRQYPAALFIEIEPDAGGGVAATWAITDDKVARKKETLVINTRFAAYIADVKTRRARKQAKKEAAQKLLRPLGPPYSYP
ncbi:cation efflux family-domain-containing protein [Pelagophyceae sp. CCMP2097]|nr:cation efflux family-domain-containing protein [Pelagophyceae sp. CCMP2097]